MKLRRVNPPAASSELAARHFANRLQYETDPSDVWADQSSGVADFIVIDARAREAYAAGHVPGAISLPHREIDERVYAWLPRQTLLITYCWGPGCNAATKAAMKLASLGYRVKEMIGGLEWWQRDALPIEFGADRAPSENSETASVG
jgi:rhodanese-related sulfurtransferase